jgi:hypothetical protein
MRTLCLIVFAFGCLMTIGVANAALPASAVQTGPISSHQDVQIAQQGPVKGGSAPRHRQNSRHKTPASEGAKPTSAPGSDDNQPRLAPGS